MTDASLEPTEDLWATAREAYLSGVTGATVCRELGLRAPTFWARAHKEKWLRRDQTRRAEPPPPVDPDAPTETHRQALEISWRRMAQALNQGRSAEAQRWLRLHDRIAVLMDPNARPSGYGRFSEDLANRSAADPDACEAAPAPSPAPRPSAPRPSAPPPPIEKVESVFRDSTPLDPPRYLNRAQRRRLQRFGPHAGAP